MKHASHNQTPVFRAATFVIALMLIISTLMGNTAGGTGSLSTVVSGLSTALFSTSNGTHPPQTASSQDPIPSPPPPPRP